MSIPRQTLDRNAHPWRVVFLVALALFVLIVIASVPLASTKTGPETLGGLYGTMIPGCVALGIWAKRSRTRWSKRGWAGRAALCLAISDIATVALVILGQALDVSQKAR